MSAAALDSALDALEDLTERIDYSVIGPRDSRVHEIRTTQFPFNTICHLGRDFGDGVWRGCSGSLIGPRLVLTAGHCLFNRRLGRPPQRIRVVPGRTDRDTMPYGWVIAQRFYVPAAYVAAPRRGRGDPQEHDYGLVLLPRAFPNIRRFMSVAAPSTAELDRLRHRKLVTIAGYPADRPIGTMWRHTERLKRVTPRRIFYSVDTCPGHSGSPVWYSSAGRHVVIGIHTSGVLDERGRPFGCSPATVLAPPGLMNSGVRITNNVLTTVRDPERAVGRTRTLRRFP